MKNSQVVKKIQEVGHIYKLRRGCGAIVMGVASSTVRESCLDG
jgi:hypothetical protein